MLTINRRELDWTIYVEELSEAHDVDVERILSANEEWKSVQVAEFFNGINGIELPTTEVMKEVHDALAKRTRVFAA